jgi:hypothetical protein
MERKVQEIEASTEGCGTECHTDGVWEEESGLDI